MHGIKFLLTLCIVILATVNIKAQLFINPQVPPVGMVDKNQLFNVTIINNTNSNFQATLNVVVRDAKVGTIVLNGTTSLLNINNGVTNINTKEIQHVFTSALPSVNANYLPIGSYIACYQLTRTDVKEAPITNECISFMVEPLAPPLLNTPVNLDTIETVQPQFTWIPPAPIDMFTYLTYDINVVEVFEGQKPYEAIQRNPVVYRNTNITIPSEYMANSVGKLEEGKNYAWQVVAKDINGYTKPTEVFSFHVKKDGITKIIEATPYIKLDQFNAAFTTMHKGYIKIMIPNYTADTKAVLEIPYGSDVNNDAHKITVEIPIKYGDNYIIKKIDDKHLEEGKAYQLVWRNSKGEAWYINFYPKNIEKK
jgi:hypothetical protein